MQTSKTSNEKTAIHNALPYHFYSHSCWKAVLPCNTRDHPNVLGKISPQVVSVVLLLATFQLRAALLVLNFLHVGGDKSVSNTLGLESVLGIWENHLSSIPFIEQNRAFFSVS